MVALVALSTHAFPSLPSLDSLDLYRLTSPSASRFSVSLCTILHHQECFPFCGVLRFRLKPPLTRVCFRPGKWDFLQCSCINSSSGLHTDTGMLFSLFREVGLNMDETQVLLGKNSALTLTSMDSIRARIFSLQSVGIDGISLCSLITKRPSLLTAEEIDHFLSFVLNDLEGKIETSQLERLFATTAPIFLVGFDQKVSLLLQRGVPREKIYDVLNNVSLSKALCVRPVEEIERMITYLSHYGGIELIVKRPKILNFDLESQLIPRVEFFRKLGGEDEDAIGTILRKLPAVLNYSVKHMDKHVEFLRSFAGLNDEKIFKIVVVYPNVFSASRERKLFPRIEFLKQCGLNSEEIFRFLIKAPLFISLSYAENIALKLVLLVKIGYRYRTKDLAMAMGSVTRTSCLNMQKVVALFLSYGFSCEDIFAMSKRHPQILQYGHGSLEKKMEYLLEEMGREIGELLAFPAFLGYQFDDRIKARYETKRKILGDGMSLNKLLTVSSESFSRRRRETPAHVIEE
ncbi:Mitochodrial transcription termination factor [Trema orientale]|uniref:Mitochodrial transcription termination factor n=1 Tax=Trema orientale TaxID=63057 RepID=A0A2P5EDP8_TREOI|nr:Mitochodrial transcription termination factor [Trema orientale]